MHNNSKQLKRGWTTGACAAAAAKAAYSALLRGSFPDPVDITLPKGQNVSFALAHEYVASDRRHAIAGVIKDAGDDPDVTHGALVLVEVRLEAQGRGVLFAAGEGVGTVTRPGLPLAVGEPAINPVPRQMIIQALSQVKVHPDAKVTVSIKNGEKIALKTLNGRLGIVGGLSILGTTGIVIPFSCAAWIQSIHRGVDVARAMGITHIAGSTGSMSEVGVQRLYTLPEEALIEMGDFVGGLLKYVRSHPVEALTIAGGIAKMTKLAQGHMDLHSKRGLVDFTILAEMAAQAGASRELCMRFMHCNTMLEVFTLSQAEGFPLAQLLAERAWQHAARILDKEPIKLEIALFDRKGECVAKTGLLPVA